MSEEKEILLESNKEKKLSFERKYTLIALYALGVVVASILVIFFCIHFGEFAAFCKKILGILSPILYALAVAYLINPIVRWFEENVFEGLTRNKPRYGLKRGVSILCAYILIFWFIAIFFSIVVPQIGSTIKTLVDSVSSYVGNLESWRDYLMQLPIPEFLRNQIETFFSSAENWFTQLVNIGQKFLPELYGVTMQVTSVFYNLIMGIIISIYILANKEKFAARSRKCLYAIFPKRTVGHILEVTHEADRIFSGFFTGKVIDSTIIGVLCFIGMTILRIPMAVLISVIIGVTNIIPYFGPFVGAIPSVIILFFVSPMKALWFAIFIMLLQQFDGNILGPKILGDSTGISAFWVIFAVVLGGGLFGVLGMFVGVPAFAVFYMLVARIVRRLLRKKHLPTDTESYLAKEETKE